MNLDEFRKQMISFRNASDDEARYFKDSHIVLDRLFSLYRRFDSEERLMADRVIAEWVLSEDETLRFDGLALVREFKILSAAAALQRLAERLVSSASIGAPDELDKVKGFVDLMSRGAK